MTYHAMLLHLARAHVIVAQFMSLPRHRISAKHECYVRIDVLAMLEQEVFMDLHPRDWRILDFWLGVILVISALWMRMYLHFLGQWGYLKWLNVPVYGFTPLLTSVPVKYSPGTVSAIQEVSDPIKLTG